MGQRRGDLLHTFELRRYIEEAVTVATPALNLPALENGAAVGITGGHCDRGLKVIGWGGLAVAVVAPAVDRAIQAHPAGVPGTGGHGLGLS